MKKERFSYTQIIRHIIQLLSFIIFPGLFILLLSSIETIIKTLIGGNITFDSVKSPILVLLSVIPITILWGRFFCSYICAFGSMQEFINFLARKLKIKQINFKEETDGLLKTIKYVVLLFLVLLWILNISIGNYSPWNIFGIYSSYKGWLDLNSWISVGGLILFVIIISSLFIERFFCKYFCPLGGIFSIISIPRLFKIKKNSKCVNCNLCSKKCPMGIDVNKETFKYGKVKSGECIDCFKCLETCTQKALYTNPKEVISGTVASIAISGIYLAGTIQPNIQIDNIISSNIVQGKYTDGTYEGSGTGNRGEVKAKVIVSGGNISSITIESYKDDDQFFNKAKSTIINEIISSQQLDIKTVSGATYSSKGIIDAVANALRSIF